MVVLSLKEIIIITIITPEIILLLFNLTQKAQIPQIFSVYFPIISVSSVINNFFV